MILSLRSFSAMVMVGVAEHAADAQMLAEDLPSLILNASCVNELALRQELDRLVSGELVTTPLLVELSPTPDAAVVRATIVCGAETYAVSLPSCDSVPASVAALCALEPVAAKGVPLPTPAIVRKPITSTISDVPPILDDRGDEDSELHVGGAWEIVGYRASRVGSGPVVFIAVRQRMGWVQPGVRLSVGVQLPIEARFGEERIGWRTDVTSTVAAEFALQIGAKFLIVPGLAVLGTGLFAEPDRTRLEQTSSIRLWSFGFSIRIHGEFEIEGPLALVLGIAGDQRFDQLSIPVLRPDRSIQQSSGWSTWALSGLLGLRAKI